MTGLETDLTADRIRDCTARGFWRNETLGVYLDRWARERPDKPAMVDGAERLTWSELGRRVERVAHGLAAHGAGPDTAISVQLPNWNEFVVLMLAAERVGAIVNPIPAIYRASELRFILNLLESSIVVIPGTFRGFDHVGMLAALRPELPRVEHVFVARGTPGPEMQPLHLLQEGAWEVRAGRQGLAGSDPNRVHEVIFTSGTTGEPKGVMHTPNTVLTIVHMMRERFGLSERDVLLMSSTFAHQTGFLYGYCLNVLLGATGVWLDLWHAATAARLIAEHRVTFTMGATPFLNDLTYLDAGLAGTTTAAGALGASRASAGPASGTGSSAAGADFSSLRLFISAGASIPRPLVRDARARLGATISAGWGMTENGLVTCNRHDDPEEKVINTDGSPLPGMELSTVDDDGQPLPPGVEGDLLVRGPSQFVGYFKRPAFTREGHTADGWFKTGDRGTLDRDGYLAITGRSKDIIIRGGENIPVVEVENVLFTHPKIAQVAIVAMPDARMQEKACAFVVARSGEAPTLAELAAFLEARGLARQKFPERVEVVSEFPMTPSGKVQKYRLRQVVAERLAAERAADGTERAADGTARPAP